MPDANHPDAILIGLARERAEALRRSGAAIAAADVVGEPDPKHVAAREAAWDRLQRIDDLIFQETPCSLVGLLIKLAPAADGLAEIQWSKFRRTMVDESFVRGALEDVMIEGIALLRATEPALAEELVDNFAAEVEGGKHA